MSRAFGSTPNRLLMELGFLFLAYLATLCQLICSTLDVLSPAQRFSSTFELFFLLAIALVCIPKVYLCRAVVWLIARIGRLRIALFQRMWISLLLWFAFALATPYIDCWSNTSEYLSDFDLHPGIFIPVRWQGLDSAFDAEMNSVILVNTKDLDKAISASKVLSEHPLTRDQEGRKSEINLSETESLQLTIVPENLETSRVFFRYFDSNLTFR